VSRANVSLRAKEAVVAFDPAQVTVAQMVEAVKHLGFQASLKGSQPATPPARR
jgi:copper chaperone CopZ